MSTWNERSDERETRGRGTEVDKDKKRQNSLIERHSVSFTTRFWQTFWSQRICCSIGAVSANRILQILATDRHMSHRMVTGSKDADPVPLIHGRFGYGVPKAKRNSIVLDEVEDNIMQHC